MLFDMLILFIIITLILFFVSVYLMETNPGLSLPFITLGMIFSILCTYGMWDVEYFYIGYKFTGIIPRVKKLFFEEIFYNVKYILRIIKSSLKYTIMGIDCQCIALPSP